MNLLKLVKSIWNRNNKTVKEVVKQVASNNRFESLYNCSTCIFSEVSMDDHPCYSCYNLQHHMFKGWRNIVAYQKIEKRFSCKARRQNDES